MQKVFGTLYKRTSSGKVQIWFMEVDGDKYRTTSGQKDGKKTTTEWTTAVAKNVGRANELSAAEQAVAECEAQYRKKLAKDYHESEANIDKAKYFAPMLARPYQPELIDWSDVILSQPKLDGMRCIATKDGLFSRNGKPWVSVPHIWAAVSWIFEDNPDAVLDGELYNHALKDDFNAISSLIKRPKPSAEDLVRTRDLVEYHVYDIAGSASGLNYSARQSQLGDLCDAMGEIPCIVKVETTICSTPAEIDQCNERYIADGYEGQIIRINNVYEQKRSKFLLKRKEFIDEEFKVIGFEEGKGNLAGAAGSVVCVDARGEEFSAGMCGTRAFVREVFNNQDRYIGTLATIRYINLTPDRQVPRHGKCKELDRVDI